MTRAPFGASIRFDGQAVGLFLDGACPEVDGEYGYMPVRAIGHYQMVVAVREGRSPRCTWTGNNRSASFDVLSIPRTGVLSITVVVGPDVDAALPGGRG